MLIRRDAIKAALHASAATTTRYVTRAVYVTPDGRVTATDGTLLVRVTDRYPYAVADYPQVPGAAGPLTPAAPGVLIPVELARKLVAATPKKTTIPILTTINVGEAGGHRYAIATDLEAPLVIDLDRANEDATFPSIDRVMVAEGSRESVKLTLSAEMLTRLAAIAREIGRATSMNAVTLDIPTGPDTRDETGHVTHAVRVTMQGSDLSVEGVCMPCRL